MKKLLWYNAGELVSEGTYRDIYVVQVSFQHMGVSTANNAQFWNIPEKVSKFGPLSNWKDEGKFLNQCDWKVPKNTPKVNQILTK